MAAGSQMSALNRRANEVRLARTELIRDIKKRQVSVAEVLRDEIPDWLENLHAHTLLRAQPYYLEMNFRRAMDAADAGLARTVGELTPRQREILATDCEEFESRRRVTKEANE
jgi:hypothetical protein